MGVKMKQRAIGSCAESLKTKLFTNRDNSVGISDLFLVNILPINIQQKGLLTS